MKQVWKRYTHTYTRTHTDTRLTVLMIMCIITKDVLQMISLHYHKPHRFCKTHVPMLYRANSHANEYTETLVISG